MIYQNIQKILPRYLILVEPTNFAINPETINDNPHMDFMTMTSEELHNKILEEHKAYQSALEKYNIKFEVFNQIDPDAYDSIFACDWCGTIRNEDFPEGIFFLFPLRWPRRRLEKNPAVVEYLKNEFKYFEDLSFYESQNMALESFGSMSIDWHNRIVYFNVSERSHLEVANYFIELLNKYSVGGKYSLRIIESADPKDGKGCYHTGLYLAFNDDTVFFCKDYVKQPEDANNLIEEFTTKYSFKYDLVMLSYEESLSMCANVFDVNLSDNTKTGLVMSKTSHDGYSAENLEKLSMKYELIVADISTINKCGGGSLRCMTMMVY